MEQGTAPTRLVLVHGTRMNADQWAPYRRLLPDLELAAVDLPGHGTKVGEPFTTDAAMETIGEAVDGAAPGQPVVLVGHSLGGYLSTLYAEAHPDALCALVLLGASADPANRLAVVYRGFARLVPRVGPARMARVTNGVLRALIPGEGFPLPDGSAYAALPAAWAAVLEQCGPQLLRGLDLPVVLANGRWDQMRIDVRRYAAACVDPHVVTIPGATHFAPLTHPEEVARVLRQAAALAVQGGTSPAAYDGPRDHDT